MTQRYLWFIPVFAAAAWMVAQTATPPASPLPYFPPGAMLALDARDFGQLVREWNASQVKRDWLASDAYRQFTVSRLSQRLQDAQRDFAGAAGVPIDMTIVEQLAGGRAAFALYDPGDLEFLLVTRMTEARFAASQFGRRRSALSPRSAGGTPYYVAETSASRRVVAFALRGEWLVVGTTEALVSQCLQRMAANTADGLTAQEWFVRAAQAAGPPGELRMVTDMAALYGSPHFRSYWVHRNRTDLQPFLATVSDLDRSATQWTERRVLVRREPTSPAPVNAALWPALLNAVPPGSGLYRGWLQPEPAFAAALIVQKFFDPTPGAGPASVFAPYLSESGDAGDENAWDDRIDQAPFVPGDTRPDATRLAAWLGSAGLTGLLHVQGTKDSEGGVWVTQDIGVVLTRDGGWNAAEWQAELARLGSIAPVPTAIDGGRIFLANSPSFLAAMRVDSLLAPPAPGTRSLGVVRHEREHARFRRWMARIDQPAYIPPAQGEERPPVFLEGVIGSLSETLRGVTEESVATSDSGNQLNQSIVYRLK